MSTLKENNIKAAMQKARQNKLPKELHIQEVWFDSDVMLVKLNSGYIMTFSLESFPTLLKASNNQRSSWELIGKGIGLHWENLDEDLSTEGLIKDYIKTTSLFNKKVEKLLAA